MNLTGRLLLPLSLLGALALGAVATELFGARAKAPPSQAPLISLEKMGHLVSLRMNYSDVIEFSEKRSPGVQWLPKEFGFGGTRVLLVAKGDCTVGTDMRAARYDRVDSEAKAVALSLPSPAPISALVNHDPRERGGSYFYAISSQGIEPIVPATSNRAKAVDHALTLAQQEVERACRQADVIGTAKKNTEELLASTFRAVGWTVAFTSQ